jgi:hypothetical protein
VRGEAAFIVRAVDGGEVHDQVLDSALYEEARGLAGEVRWR